MSDAIKLIKKMDEAFKAKDTEGFRATLHPEYSFKGPMMGFDNVDEAVAFVENCPFEFHNENETYAEQGDKIFRVFDWVVTAPFQKTIRMVEYMKMKDGKLHSAELFYDTAEFPQEAMAAMAAE